MKNPVKICGQWYEVPESCRSMMTRYQIINDCGMTIDIIESVTAKFAIEKARGKRNQLDQYYDKYWQIDTVNDNKICLKKVER